MQTGIMSLYALLPISLPGVGKLLVKDEDMKLLERALKNLKLFQHQISMLNYRLPYRYDLILTLMLNIDRKRTHKLADTTLHCIYPYHLMFSGREVSRLYSGREQKKIQVSGVLETFGLLSTLSIILAWLQINFVL